MLYTDGWFNFPHNLVYVVMSIIGGEIVTIRWTYWIVWLYDVFYDLFNDV